ncbi:hypothetical protein ACWV26_12540 [Rummeliibacillus sp. JY-2-4R]
MLLEDELELDELLFLPEDELLEEELLVEELLVEELQEQSEFKPALKFSSLIKEPP